MPRKLRWDCNRGGPGKNCFNLKCRLKFGVFDDCFPRRINFSDVDGLAEIGGQFCMLEWKNDGGAIQFGQHLAYERFTANSSNVVIVVHGNAEDMSVRGFGYYWDGVYHEPKPATIMDLKNWIRRWVCWADAK